MASGWRRRVGRLVAVAGVAFLLAHFSRHWPRKVELRVDTGARHGQFTEAHITVREPQRGAALQGVRLYFASGSPQLLRHVLQLPPGRYELDVELRGSGVRRAVHSALTVPTEGVVRMAVDRPEAGR